MGVSVCIPTYKRRALLCECIRSVMSSKVRPLELVVSDDARDPEINTLLERFPRPDGIELRYVANRGDRGQAANVQNAFEHAGHERVVLMHDDDYFLPGGLDALDAAWQRMNGKVDAVYGRVQFVEADGAPNPRLTELYDRKYCRTEPGLSPSNLWSALMQQLPYNGMMLRRSVVLATGVPSEREVGRYPVDYHFGINYALASTRPFLLIDDFISAYRLSAESVGRGNKHEPLDRHLSYAALRRISPRTALEREALDLCLARAAGPAVLGLLAERATARAWEIYRRHAWSMRSSWRLKIKVPVVLLGASLGVRWPDWILAQRGHR